MSREQLGSQSDGSWSCRFSCRRNPWAGLYLDLYHISLLGRLVQWGAGDCRGRWWSNSESHKAAPLPVSWRMWWGWSDRGAKAAVSPCPVPRPSSGSGCRGYRTRGRADGCDLQGEESSCVWEQRRHSEKKEVQAFSTKQIIHIAAERMQTQRAGYLASSINKTINQ